jgi:hypothetical protein
LFMLCLSGGLWAQTGTSHRYFFTVAQPLDENGEKQLIELLLAWDPYGSFQVNGAMREVDMRTVINTEKGALQAHLWDADVVLVDWEADVPLNAEVRSPIEIPGFPKYYATGDVTADDRRYDEAKQAWIAAHGEEYEHYLKQGE